MTTPTPLSPAAQAVLDASMEHSGPAFEPLVRRMIAAALRAAADQVVPEEDEPCTEEWIGQSAWSQANYRARFKLLAIAAELEGAR